MKTYKLERYLNDELIYSANATELDLLKEYFQIKEKLTYNAMAKYRINSLTYDSQGTIKLFDNTTIIGEHCKYRNIYTLID